MVTIVECPKCKKRRLGHFIGKDRIYYKCLSCKYSFEEMIENGNTKK